MTSHRAVEDRFPKLVSDGYQITSPRDDGYNCVAWIARDIRRWWEPGIDGCFWPAELGEGDGLDDYIRLFESLGFRPCADGGLSADREKIAVYANGDDFEHVAFQRADGMWSSKLGRLNDVRHSGTDSLAGRGPFEYTTVQLYMSRPRQPHQLAETGLLFP